MLADLFNKTAKIYRKEKGSTNEFGEKSYVLRLINSTLQCTTQPVVEDLTIERSGVEYKISRILYCLYGEDILPGDIVEVDNEKFLVVSVLDDGGRQHHLKVYLSKK